MQYGVWKVCPPAKEVALKEMDGLRGEDARARRETRTLRLCLLAAVRRRLRDMLFALVQLRLAAADLPTATIFTHGKAGCTRRHASPIESPAPVVVYDGGRRTRY